MGTRQIYLLVSLSILVLFACSKDSNSEDIIEVSPFEKFIGTWTLESEVFDGAPTGRTNDILHFNEDFIKSDSIISGYYHFSGRDMPTEAVIELTNNENEIIIDLGSISLICTYSFINENRLELDDSTDDWTQITTWVR